MKKRISEDQSKDESTILIAEKDLAGNVMVMMWIILYWPIKKVFTIPI